MKVATLTLANFTRLTAVKARTPWIRGYTVMRGQCFFLGAKLHLKRYNAQTYNVI